MMATTNGSDVATEKNPSLSERDEETKAPISLEMADAVQKVDEPVKEPTPPTNGEAAAKK